MRVEAITTAERLCALAPHWTRLWERCPEATPFQTPEWCLAWWQHLGHGKLFTVAVWAASELIGLAPLFLYVDPQGTRRLLVIGTSITDYMDLLLAPERSSEALDAICDHLYAVREEWDVVDLQEIRSVSPLRNLTLTRFQSGEQESYLCPVVELPATVEEFRAGLGSGLRRNLKRYCEQLKSLGPVEFATADDSTLEEFLEAFFRLHTQRWQLRGEGGMLADPRARGFHCAVAHSFCRAGMLRLHGIRLNGKLVAVVYAFAAHGRAYSYLGGFEPELSRYSPGALILGYSLEQAIQEGIREWDFLRGPEPYKYHWNAVDRPNYWRLWWHSERGEAAFVR